MDIRRFLEAKRTADEGPSPPPPPSRSSPRRKARATAGGVEAQDGSAAASKGTAEDGEETPDLDLPAPPDANPEGLSEYELQRLATIRENNAVLSSLGLATDPGHAQRAPPAKRKKAARGKRAQKAGGPQAEPSRRSKRSRGEQPDYTGESIDTFGEELDRAAARPAPRAGKTVEEVVGAARELVLANRARLEASAASRLATEAVSGDDAHWLQQAKKAWGAKVLLCEPGSWEEYVRSRLAVNPPVSPYCLLQEIYSPDCWKLLIACVLMSRVSSADVKHKALNGFFARYPTPSAALDADPADALAILAPLGLFENRFRSVVAITTKFLEAPVFTVSLEPEHKIWGVGRFAVESFRIFCRNEGRDFQPDDKNLRAFTDWLKAQPQN